MKVFKYSKENNKNLRFFQSWKSAVSEHLADYESSVTAMSNQFVDQLIENYNSICISDTIK
ncbi:MAG: hypothetical protein ACTHK0_17465 [Ginsengibacter sp.]